MSFYTVAFVGMAPFGSLLAGALAHAIGAPRTVMLSGAFCLTGAAAFAAPIPKIHPTYLFEPRHPAAGGRPPG